MDTTKAPNCIDDNPEVIKKLILKWYEKTISKIHKRYSKKIAMLNNEISKLDRMKENGDDINALDPYYYELDKCEDALVALKTSTMHIINNSIREVEKTTYSLSAFNSVVGHLQLAYHNFKVRINVIQIPNVEEKINKSVKRKR